MLIVRWMTVYCGSGLPNYYPDTINIPTLGLCNMNTASIENNIMNNSYTPYITGWFGVSQCGARSGNTNITACNNTYNLTVPFAYSSGYTPPADILNDGACPVIPAPSVPIVSPTTQAFDYCHSYGHSGSDKN